MVMLEKRGRHRYEREGEEARPGREERHEDENGRQGSTRDWGRSLFPGFPPAGRDKFYKAVGCNM